MKSYITPDGNYYEGVHAHADSIECTKRPDGHVLTGGWQDDPMNASVCWREKTSQEIDDDEDIEVSNGFNKDKILKIIAKAFLNHENRVRVLESKSPITLSQLITALRKL